MKTKKNPVAVKYNGNQLDRTPPITLEHVRNTMSYDYMTFNYSGVFKPLENHPRIEIEVLPYGTPVFEKVANVLIDKHRFAVVTWSPRNSTLGENLVQIKIENAMLYRMELQELKAVLVWFVAVMRLTYVGVSRLDVCCDYENGSTYFRNMLADILSQRVLISGREKHFKHYNEILNCHSKTKKGVLTHQGFSVGKKSSSKYLRVYNKSVEMEEIKYKHHIAEHWQRADFENLNDVWRFEYALNSTFMREYNVQFDDVFNESFIKTLLETAYKNHFVLKENTGKSEVNKEKTVYNIVWEVLQDVGNCLKKVKKQLFETIQKSQMSIKRQIKGLYRGYYSTKNEHFNEALKFLVRTYQLREWFKQKQDSYLQEFRRQTIKINNALE